MPRKKGVPKVATIVRLTPEAKDLLEQLADSRGMPVNVYVETHARQQAKREGLSPRVPTPESKGE